MLTESGMREVKKQISFATDEQLNELRLHILNVRCKRETELNARTEAHIRENFGVIGLEAFLAKQPLKRKK